MIKKIRSFIYGRLNSDGWLWRTSFKLLKRSEYDMVKNNFLLKDIEKGKRCFILGNGPSLNQIDFGTLKNEDVFTVNMLMDHPDFLKLHSNYHVIADGAIFNMGNNIGLEENYYLKKFKNLEKCSDLKLFVPVGAKKAITEIQLDRNIDIRYFKIANIAKKIRNFNLAEGVPAFNKVIHYAIGIAIYMGYDEIFLLGCEETGVLTYINLQLENLTKNDHCYIDSEKVKNSWKNQLNKYGLAWVYRQEAEVLENYEKLFAFCKSKGIKLVNLTEKTLIDSIPQQNIEDILV